MNTMLGKKIKQTQMFLSDGKRIPVSKVEISGNTVVGIRTKEKNSHNAILLGFGQDKRASKSIIGQVKGANLKIAPRFFREVIVEEASMPALGEIINATIAFKPGDMVSVSGVTKGKGFAGVVKRHHFKGGSKTHGASDRTRAPGSIGSTTSPGRVWKNVRMGGHMGDEQVTATNLAVYTADTAKNLLLIEGAVPGAKNSLVIIRKSNKGS